jgi:hypothetical protein
MVTLTIKSSTTVTYSQGESRIVVTTLVAESGGSDIRRTLYAWKSHEGVSLTADQARDLLQCLQDALGESKAPERNCATCGSELFKCLHTDLCRSPAFSCWHPKPDAKPASERTCKTCSRRNPHYTYYTYVCPLDDDCCAPRWEHWQPKSEPAP